MSISLISTPIAYDLEVGADGKLAIATQSENAVDAALNEVKGTFNGGKSGSVGMINTLATIGKVWLGAKFRDQIASIPLIGSTVQ